MFRRRAGGGSVRFKCAGTLSLRTRLAGRIFKIDARALSWDGGHGASTGGRNSDRSELRLVCKS